MTDSDDLSSIIDRILRGSHTEDDIKQLQQPLNLASDRQLRSQLGKYNVNIGEGKEIHIGDRIYIQWDESAIKALIRQAKSEDIVSPVLKPPTPSNYNPQTWVGREAAVKDLLPKLQEKTRLLWITGISGIGKTALGECLASQSWEINQSFQWIYLEVLEGQSPDFVSVGADLLAKLGDIDLNPQERNNPEQLAKRLLQKLQSHSYWIQMDSLERLLNDAQPTNFIDPYWVTFLQRCLTDSNIISRLVLTAQGFPTALGEFSDRYPNTWAELRLDGLLQVEQLEFFTKRGVIVEPANRHLLTRIAQIYEGHPLVLKVIAEDILNSFAGDVNRYWQVNQLEFEQVARELHATRLDETEYNEALDRKVRERIERSLKQLPVDALDLLCRSAVFRRPVPKKFWLAMIGDRTPPQQKAAYQVLGDRALIEKEAIEIRQHNLIRSVAYNLLCQDSSLWETAERQAANLWLTVYKPAPDAPKLETLRGYLEAFHHYGEVKDWDASGDLPYTQLETGHTLQWQLFIWSYFRELVPIYQTLIKIAREIGDRQGESAALNGLGNAYNSLAEYQQAIDLCQQNLTIAREIGDRQGEGLALGNLGIAYNSLGRHQQAINLYQQSLTIAREIGNRQGEGIALGNLGNAYNSLGEYQQAIDLYLQHLTIAREIADRQGEGIALGNLGNTYDLLGEYQQAIDLYQQSLTIARETADRQVERTALNGLGNTYNSLGEYQQAIDLYQQSLTIAREIGNRQGEGNALNGLGNAYNSLGEYQQAIDLLQQSLTIAREIDNCRGESNALGSLGNAYNSLGEYQQATNLHQQSLTIAREIGDRQGESAALGNLGIAYNSLGRYQQAIDLLQQCLTIAREIGDRQAEGISLENLGDVLIKLERYSEALEALQKSLETHRKIGFRPGEAETLKKLAKLHQVQDEIEIAQHYCQQALALATELGIPLAEECRQLKEELEKSRGENPG